MLTVLITRGQIIIHSGYFSCSLPVSQGGNSSRQLAGWRAGRVRSGGSQRSAPSQRNRQHRGGRGHGGVVPVQQGWRVLRPSAETKGSCGPRWVLVEVWFVAGSGIIWMWFFFFTLFQICGRVQSNHKSICDGVANCVKNVRRIKAFMIIL